MTMTDERLAELRATIAHAKATDDAPGVAWGQHIMRFDDVLAVLDHIDAQAATIARLREAAKRIADHPNFYITACECGEPECATTQFIAAIAEAEGAQ